MTRAEEFEELRPLLFSIAYRILASVSEAEDAVQETWLRYQASATTPISLKSFLAAVVTRVSIDTLRSARVRRETYVGQWLPYLAECVGAKPPRRLPVWVARAAAGEVAVSMLTRTRGSSNARAKRELGWELRWPSWRQGFRHGLAQG